MFTFHVSGFSSMNIRIECELQATGLSGDRFHIRFDLVSDMKPYPSFSRLIVLKIISIAFGEHDGAVFLIGIIVIVARGQHLNICTFFILEYQASILANFKLVRDILTVGKLAVVFQTKLGEIKVGELVHVISVIFLGDYAQIFNIDDIFPIVTSFLVGRKQNVFRLSERLFGRDSIFELKKTRHPDIYFLIGDLSPDATINQCSPSDELQNLTLQGTVTQMQVFQVIIRILNDFLSAIDDFEFVSNLVATRIQAQREQRRSGVPGRIVVKHHGRVQTAVFNHTRINVFLLTDAQGRGQGGQSVVVLTFLSIVVLVSNNPRMFEGIILVPIIVELQYGSLIGALLCFQP
mmetsp:Transcript_16334/g.44935  ORF Transcript_16334/g.44935 Transcript_16334/m.44935 type:complete len:349 (+) Transcript_16334:111-1157(+)